jgi:hypothetical protein
MATAKRKRLKGLREMSGAQDAAAAPVRSDPVLRGALTAGRYDARKIAHLLDWTLEDVAVYLGRDPSTVSRHSASARYQEPLARLAALIQEVRDLFGDLELVRAWLRTPNRLLDASPKTLILSGQVAGVTALVREYHSGLAL